MPRLLLLFLLGIPALQASAQVSDIISVRKKNGRTIKSFVAGVPIELHTQNGTFVKGPIKAIRNDSLFVTVYVIRIVPTYMCVTVVDTAAVYLTGMHHRDIKNIRVFRRPRFLRGKIDRLLIIGGAGYFGLNVLNGLGQGSLTEKENVQRLGIALGAAGLGFVIKKFFPVDRFSRKRHPIVYIPVK